MLIWNLLRRLREGKVAARHAERIVARSISPVHDAVISRAPAMPRAEARGYVRVKALAQVARIIEKQTSSPEGVPIRLQNTVTTLATERLVVEVMRLLSHGAAKAAPRRKAA